MAVGCKSGLESLALFYEGNDIPAEWDGLKGKKVAVVCKPLTSQEFSNSGVDRALAEGICERLKAHVKDIQIIDPREGRQAGAMKKAWTITSKSARR